MPEGQRQKTKQLQYVYKENMQVVYTFPSLKKKKAYIKQTQHQFSFAHFS